MKYPNSKAISHPDVPTQVGRAPLVSLVTLASSDPALKLTIFADERQRASKAAGKVKSINEVHGVQQPNPLSFVARTTGRSSEMAEAGEEHRLTLSPDSIEKKRSVHLF